MWLRLTDDGKPRVVNFDNVLWFRPEYDGARTLIQATNYEASDIEHLTFFVDQSFESICTRLSIKPFEEG